MRVNRRQFVKSVGATLAGAGLSTSGFTRLIPFVIQPDDIVPGVSTWFATSCRECPAGCSMIVRNRDAHAVKCEGNPFSPVNRGRLCARGQAALMGLYDPDRVAAPLRRVSGGTFSRISWNDALKSVGAALAKRPRIALMTDLQTGSLETLMRTWLAAFGSNRYLVYEPIDYEAVKAVSGGVIPTYHLENSDYLISFGADFLESWISPVEFAAKFAAMRSLKNGRRGAFVYVGPRVSMTAANADRRFIVPPGESASVARAILSGTSAGLAFPGAEAIGAVAREFAAARAPLVLPGTDPDSARAAQILSGGKPSALADTGLPHALSATSSRAEIGALMRDMERGNIDLLIVHNANPAYALPAADQFREALRRVPLVVNLSSFLDETASLSDWILPSSTPLESWGDYAPYPGVTNLMQPTMGLLFDTRQAGDILIGLATHAGMDAGRTFTASSFYEYLRLRWGFALPAGATAETPAPGWEALVEKGGQWAGGGTAAPATGAAVLPPEQASSPGKIRLWAYPHIYYYDGRGANRRWLQEMPEPVTNAVWGTWAEFHPATAARLGIATDDIVVISYRGASIRVPAIVREGIAPDTVAVPIGQGHESYGRFASGAGANVLSLLAMASPAVTVRKTGETQWATRIKGSDKQYGREVVQTVSLGETLRRQEEILFPMSTGYGKNDFYPGHQYRKHRWAMTVDLDRCIGCHACETACYAENNLGVVGPEGIWRRREMAWLRIDRYEDWSSPAPILFQPMLCQHCDAAPCEPVCPVYAAAHNEEGLNMQIYNRCIGTRYCSNNCPYKVRRFNWYDYEWPAPLNYQLNPDVSVRCRGVMEKCTFCIQRIREAEINALRENRDVRDGEIVPACVQTCPTGVFTFGDLKDPHSKVSAIIRTDPRAYQVLRRLNTKPAVIYLKKIVARH